MKIPHLWFATALALVCALPATARDEERVEKRIAATPTGEVSIANVSGSVKVEGWNRSEVEVTGTLESNVDRLDLIRDGARIVVKVVLPSNSGSRSDADITVRVPTGASLEVTTVNADIDVRNVEGAQRLKTVSGGVRATGLQGDAEMKSVSGDLNLRGRGKPLDLRASTVSGNVVIAEGAGDFDLVTVSGDVVAEVSPVGQMRIRTTSGDARLTGRLAANARVEAETVSGDITIAAAPLGGLSAEADSFSGDLTSCFGAKGESTGRGPGSRMSLKRGDGSARVRVKTLSGDVRVCDR